jgi:hypothetical protein
MFLCIRPSVSKLKKKSILCFSYTKKQYFSMYFGFNNQFIEVKRTLAKISKTTKNLFCFVLVSGIMNLYDFLERVDDRCDDIHVRQSIFPGLKILSSLQYREVLPNCFLIIEFNYVIIHIKLCRCVERNQQLVAHIWSHLILPTVRMTCP